MRKNYLTVLILIVALLEISNFYEQAQAHSGFSENNSKHHHRMPVDDDYEDDDDENEQISVRYYNRVQQHIKRQEEHKKLLYEQKLAKSHVQHRHPKNVPRLWQHLIDSSEETTLDSSELRHAGNALHKRKTQLDNYDMTDGDEEHEAENDSDENDMVNINDNLSRLVPAHENAKKLRKHLRCPKCDKHRSVSRVTEEELTQLRIEYVKQQILEKLRIKEPPNVSAVRLPIDPIDPEPSKSKENDDYYARSNKKFIFLEKEERVCPQNDETSSSICFSFKIDDADIDGFDVNTAVLWIFKNKNLFQRQNDSLVDKETVVVSELQQTPDPRYLPISKTIAIQSFNAYDEWLKIDIEWPTRRWFGNHELSHLIQISCQSCGQNSLSDMISIDKDYRPFIMISTKNRTRTSRQKRGINCTNGVTECCREKLYISFKDIGWGDWIIQPHGYDAYFCRGSCNSIASVAQSTSHHNTFLQKLLRSANSSKPLELIPCCTAKQYSSLQLVFMDSNNTATQRTFPNMVVESCGCR